MLGHKCIYTRFVDRLIYFQTEGIQDLPSPFSVEIDKMRIKQVGGITINFAVYRKYFLVSKQLFKLEELFELDQNDKTITMEVVRQKIMVQSPNYSPLVRHVHPVPALLETKEWDTRKKVA